MSNSLDAATSKGGNVSMPMVTDLRQQFASVPLCLADMERASAAGIDALLIHPSAAMALDDPSMVGHLAEQIARLDTNLDVGLVGALTRGLEGKSLSDMAALKRAGCVGLSAGDQWIADSRVMRSAMQYARDLELTLFITPRDPWLADGGVAHEGRVANRLGLPGIPVAAETAALARDLALVAEISTRTHFGPLSSAAALEMIRLAAADGLPVSADTTIAHLLLNEMDLIHFDPNRHLAPPLRAQEDQAALLDAVRGGLLMVSSGHHGLDVDAKMAPFPAVTPGASTMESLVPAGMHLLEIGLSLDNWLAAVSTGPRKLLGLSRPPKTMTVDTDAPAGTDPSAHSPFRNMRLPGRIVD